MPETSENEHDALSPAEETLRDAGFHPRAASRLATFNQLLTPFVLLVSIGALLWIGFHLWPVLDAAAWQQWADDNPGFFAPLQPGDTVAIVPELHSHAGLTVTRTITGVTVERHLWFPFDEVPFGLVIEPQAAEAWLQLDYGEEFWPRWHALAAGSGVRVYQHLDAGTRRGTGYRAFLASLQPLTSR